MYDDAVNRGNGVFCKRVLLRIQQFGVRRIRRDDTADDDLLDLDRDLDDELFAAVFQIIAGADDPAFVGREVEAGDPDGRRAVGVVRAGDGSGEGCPGAFFIERVFADVIGREQLHLRIGWHGKLRSHHILDNRIRTDGNHRSADLFGNAQECSGQSLVVLLDMDKVIVIRR